MQRGGTTTPPSGAAATARGRLVVLGVDPADPRAVAELPRWVPTTASGLYRVPALDRRSIDDLGLRANPPGVAFDAVQRLRGVDPAPSTLEDATTAASRECDLPVRTLQPTSGRSAVSRSTWWTAGAWIVTALAVLVPIIAIGLLLVASGLLVWLLALSLVTAAVALLVGFWFAHEAAAIRRVDASYAGVLEDECDGGFASASAADEGTLSVLVVPTRNAAGIAAALRERGIAAESRRVVPGAEPTWR